MAADAEGSPRGAESAQACSRRGGPIRPGEGRSVGGLGARLGAAALALRDPEAAGRRRGGAPPARPAQSVPTEPLPMFVKVLVTV